MEKLFWSIALPGFGQFLNGKYIKGITLIVLEFIVNVQSNLNDIIILSFNGQIEASIDHTNYQWLMFYPCLYMYAIWDAYKDSGEAKSKGLFFPFVSGAYFATVGIIYSRTLTIFGILIGPVWLPILFMILGIVIGVFVKRIVYKRPKTI
ncbi:hypothetical protein [Peribacillus alkalitolerans]|uniref:hypothetical protein n=1 Tax=Peribacillus alkalitolerans TaxID=1550385 RepID=UPI0013D1DD69|nr:hypothetical protein [Peribacillus alkalitolerans]